MPMDWWFLSKVYPCLMPSVPTIDARMKQLQVRELWIMEERGIRERDMENSDMF